MIGTFRRRADSAVALLALAALLLNLAMTAGVAYVAFRIGSVIKKMDVERACEKAGYSRANSSLDL